MNRQRLTELRALVEAEEMSWGDAIDLQAAFEAIDPATLPEPAENAGWSDMLDELEARLPEERPARSYCVGLPVIITVRDDGTVTYEVDASEAGAAIRETYPVIGDEDGPDEPTVDADADVIDTDHDRRNGHG